MIGGSLDGASVNFGVRAGIVARFQAASPFAIFVHCAGHRTALCAHSAMEEDPYAKDWHQVWLIFSITISVPDFQFSAD